MSGEPPLLRVDNLEKYFDRNEGLLDSLLNRQEDTQAVDGVSFTLDENEARGIIGESGCGKSTLLMTIIGLHEPTGGSIYYRGRDITEFDRAEWRDYRASLQMVFQDPFNSLNPMMSVRENLMEQLEIHDIEGGEERLRDTLEDVELSPASNYLSKLPKQLSGGEKQRVSIARALLVDPDVLLADEPVSMLDVSTQAAILKMLLRLREEREMSILYISHDLSTLSHVCQDIHVMYLGRFIETAPTEALLASPDHPYTQELMNAIPIFDPYLERERTTLDEAPPDPVGLGEGCRFRDRCPERMDICDVTPLDVETDEGHSVACHLYYDHEERAGSVSRGDGAMEVDQNAD